MIPDVDASAARFAPFAQRMRDDGMPELAIAAFRRAYGMLTAGESGMVPERDITPVESLPDISDPSGGGERDEARRAIGRAALGRAVMIKLNGGLGTSMGLDGPKSLITVREGLSFLDIISRQLIALNRMVNRHVPLVLMNSFSTRDASLAALEHYSMLHGPIPPDFVQHRVPKVLREDFSPALWNARPDLEWCPPGHGDIYAALVTSGVLPLLIEDGYRYAFISNADNLGATLDPLLLGYLVERGCPFLMEVADRTTADRKGGHLARRPDGRLMLRESAQCPPEDLAAFQDIERHRYFNTNSIWLDLRALESALAAHDGVLPLPLIRNAKTLDPRDPSSPPVYQLESAMGAAIELFDGAEAIRVPRTRFAPVKTTDDLFALWSDAYQLTEEYRIVLADADVDDGTATLPASRRSGVPPGVSLDPRYFRSIDQLRARLPHGAPSLRYCRSLTVVGDVTFGAGIRIEGDVRIEAPEGHALRIADGTVLSTPSYPESE